MKQKHWLEQNWNDLVLLNVLAACFGSTPNIVISRSSKHSLEGVLVLPRPAPSQPIELETGTGERLQSLISWLLLGN